MTIPSFRAWIIIAACALLAACGSGGSSSMSDTTKAPADSDQGGGTAPVDIVSTGVITGFGSIFVNGVEFDTNSATVDTDESTGLGEARLQVGMLVTVDGQVNTDGRTGAASRVHYGDFMIGPVDTIDQANYRFTMMGHDVYIDDLSMMDGIAFSDIVPGTMLEVSGFTGGSGVMSATWISPAAADSTARVFGPVSSLDASAMTFMLGDLLVDYRAASLPAETMADGMMVAVSGDVPTPGNLRADRVVLRQQNHPAAGEHVVVEGVVESAESGGQFALQGQACVIDASTTFESGMTDGDIVQGARVHLEGMIDEDGRLLVASASMHEHADMDMVGAVSGVSMDTGEMTVDGVTFSMEPETMFVDAVDHMRQFNLQNITAGDTVEVHGMQLADGSYIAVSVERRDATLAGVLVLAGDVMAIDQATQSFTLQDRRVRVDDATIIVSISGDNLSPAGFFAAIAVGDAVTVKGTASDGDVIASEIMLGEHHGMMGMM